MKSVLIVAVLLLSLFIARSQQRKAVFIIVDGIPADVIEKLNTPTIKAISHAGGYARAIVGGEAGAYNQTPTISAVGYNTVLTGTWVNKHNVWDNDIADPNYHYKTIFRFFKDQYPEKKTAVFSSWLDNRTKLVGDGLPQTGRIATDYHVDGLELDTIRFPHDKETAYMLKIDETVTDSAAAAIRSNAPDLSWVYLEFTDDMGHAHGDSKEFYDAVESMDKKIGRLWDAVQYRQKQFGEDWLLIVTTDHGRNAATGRDHGGQSEREKSGWIATNAKGLNDYFRKGKPSIADIMPTLARFMQIQIPREDQMEVDGTSLIGSNAATDLRTDKAGSRLTVRWKSAGVTGDAKLWLSTTNNYATGGKDNYVLVATVPLNQQQSVIDLSKYSSPFCKIVLETPDNFLGRWEGKEKTKRAKGKGE